MSRRLLNLEKAKVAPAELTNPMELVKPRPVAVQNFIPNEPVFLTKDQWDMVYAKTYDATAPFKVEVTVIDDKKEEEDGVEEVKEEETPYIPRKTRKTKK